MKYFGQNTDINNSNEKTGVLITNLGTPEKPNCPKLRKYLTQFLTDPRVIELPSWLRQFLVRGIIVNTRSHKSAAAYRQIWTEQGSPLMIHTRGLSVKSQEKLGREYQIEFGMRYGQPSIKEALQSLHEKGCRKVVVIPMYPQYSGSTTGAVMDAVGDSLKQQRWVPELHFINAYHTNKHYIDALCSSIKNHWKEHTKAEKLIFSFHGVPQRYVKSGDPYQHQCEETVTLVTNKLGLKENEWLLVYQSKIGREPWLQPYCDETMKSLPSQGIRSVDVICPGFSADCLETLEEIEQENKEYFFVAGGQSFQYIPCLNSNDAHVEMVSELVSKNYR